MVNVAPSARSLILARLRSGEGPVSGSSLAEELGTSRVAVWKQIEALRTAGYDLETGHSGYRLASEGDFLFPWEFPGREASVVRFERTDSTMDRALDLALGDAPAGTVVVAESQTKGRGRRGKRWRSPSGGLFATVLDRPALQPWRMDRLAMAGSIALCGALRQLTGEPFTLAWPNDVYLAGRKTAGILVEYLAEGDELRFALLGLGVNVANKAPGEGAFSLAELPSPRPSRRDILASFLDLFEAQDPGRESLAEEWNSLSGGEGRPVVSRIDGRPLGRAAFVDGEGRLVVRLPNGGEDAFRPGEAMLTEKEHVR